VRTHSGGSTSCWSPQYQWAISHALLHFFTSNFLCYSLFSLYIYSTHACLHSYKEGQDIAHEKSWWQNLQWNWNTFGISASAASRNLGEIERQGNSPDCYDKPRFQEDCMSSFHTHSDRNVDWLRQGHVVMPQMFNASYSLNIILPQFGGWWYGRDCMVECTERSHGCPKHISRWFSWESTFQKRRESFLRKVWHTKSQNSIFFLDWMGGFFVGEGLGRNFFLRMCQKWWSMEGVVFKLGVVCLTRVREGFTVSRDIWMRSSTHVTK
jgi:hypothetical protein